MTTTFKQTVKRHAANVLTAMPRPVSYHLWGRWQDPPRFEYLPARARGRLAADLRACVADAARAGGRSLFVFSPLTWYTVAFQRPHQMARALAAAGVNVIYLESWDYVRAFNSPEAAAGRRFTGVKAIGPNLHLFRCPVEWVASCLDEAAPEALLMSWPDAAQAQMLPREAPTFVVYEMVDDHSLGGAAVDAAFRERHRHWVRNADLMLATADNLAAQLRPERPDVLLLPNGVRVEDWQVNPPPPVPSDLATARKAPVVVGYHGAIAHWFDWELLGHAARARPDWSFVLVGPAYQQTADDVQRRAAAFPNVHFLGPKAYGELRQYTAHFDVAMIPFRLNDITHACSPLKLFEYMACGKPIVATRMREILKYRSVLFVDEDGAGGNRADGLAERIDEALARRGDAEYRELLALEARANTWQARAETLIRALDEERQRHGGVPRRRRTGI